MKAKSYLDKRTELLPRTRTSLFVTDGWRGREEEEEEGWARAEWLLFACSYAIREIGCCCVCLRGRRHTDHMQSISVTIQIDRYGFCFVSVHL